MNKVYNISVVLALLGFVVGLFIAPYIYQPQAGQDRPGASAFAYTSRASESPMAGRKELYVLEASTLKPMVDLVKDVVKARGYVVYDEAKGSTQLAREITDLGKRADLFIPVDSEVVEKILMPSGAASWYIVIATSSMVFVYSNASEDRVRGPLDLLSRGDLKGFFDEILSGSYRIGVGNPDNVPQGYRTLIMLKLAGIMIWGNESFYMDRFNGLVKAGRVVYARDAASLVSLLQTGAIDIAFIYLHEARLYSLKHASLPKQLDLSDPSLRDFYAGASYTTSTGTVIKGAPIEIVVTIPKTAVNREAALAVISYLLSDKGRVLMREAGIIPVDNPELRGSYSDMFR